jgi:excisionase family DNA binding protein
VTDTVSDSVTDSLSDGLTPAEAAARLGVSERTIWRRIKAGKLKTEHTADGVRVLLTDRLSDSPVSVSDTMTDRGVSTSDNVSDTVSVAPELMKALEMVDSLSSRNEQLAGQVGFLQAKLQDAESTIQRLLMAPKDEPNSTIVEQTPAEQPRRSWWQRLVGR